MHLYTMLAHFLAAYAALAAEDTNCSQGGPCHQHQQGRSDTNQPVETEVQRKMKTDKAMEFSTTPKEVYKTEVLEEPQRQNITEILTRPRAGGEFGLSAEWRKAIAIPATGSERPEIRGGRCQTEDMKERVRIILERRSKTPADSRVAMCVRSKDFGRFLPEWVAFHYALGVDEVKLFDDDSVDRTVQALFPFMQAGIVKYKLETIFKTSEMKPLTECLNFYLEKRSKDPHAPKWILFHDTDEYLFPVDTSLTIPEALSRHNSTCCVQVKRIQYGSGKLIETPRGLVLENFLTHAGPGNFLANRLPKVMVNLDPTEPEKGVVYPKLPSMHNAQGCECEKLQLAEMRINHYLGSLGDFYDHSRRYWENYLKNLPTEKKVGYRDINDHTSDTITFWACATREILYRIVNQLDLETAGLDKTSP